MEGIFYKTPTLWKFQLSFIYFFKIFGLTKTPLHPPPRKFQSPLLGEYGYLLELHILDMLIFIMTKNK